MRDIILPALVIAYPLQISTKRLRDRLDLLIVLAAGVLFLLFARTTVDWHEFPPWLWLIGLGLFAVAVALTGRAWPHLTWLSSKRPQLPPSQPPSNW
ncbi:hypothetical protein EV644_105285 [Kribbella orskensis]|uniref:Uncharacterized protein n=1 Tax=Kribbella orskensis TaxID=2512216 RepID=A0ABY2BLK0_9ACTN|nr:MULTISPECIES: hypothetical protein [Kribbella]TCN41000.1 hypothetical protein EV642_104285 [Kribbella sp. VKM Ac-2500]TCO24252.1 hypothetical protein EV644_105285 [Kribbella orskensis]